MIFKNRKRKTDKKIKPFMGILLFAVSIILLVLTAPFGLLYGLFYNLFKKGFQGFGEYALKMAVSIDQLGNVAMQHLLNILLLKQGAYRFGNRDETISSAIGRNKKMGLLSGFGIYIDRFLDYLDPDHSLNSIDYYIEPSEQISDQLAWVYLLKKRLLCIRYRDRIHYCIPRIAKQPDQSESETLSQEMEHALGISILAASLIPVGIFEGKALGTDDGLIVRLACYEAEFTGKITPRDHIIEAVWLSYQERKLVAGVDQVVFDHLKEKEVLI